MLTQQWASSPQDSVYQGFMKVRSIVQTRNLDTECTLKVQAMWRAKQLGSMVGT